MNVILAIAGSDSGGGAGIQADIKTCEALGAFATTAVTAVTAQNTVGVRSIAPIPPEIVADQIAAVLEDFPVSAIKIGMLASASIASVVADHIEQLAGSIPVVLDPVMVATSGDRLLDPDAESVVRDRIAPLATIATPNRSEAEILAGATSRADPVDLGRGIVARGTGAVLVTGGDAGQRKSNRDQIDDVLVTTDATKLFSHPRLESTSTHGTGCTLSTAIAVGLAAGRSLIDAVDFAGHFVRQGIVHAPGIGSGHGPLGHGKAGRFVENNEKNRIQHT